MLGLVTGRAFAADCGRRHRGRLHNSCRYGRRRGSCRARNVSVDVEVGLGRAGSCCCVLNLEESAQCRRSVLEQCFWHGPSEARSTVFPVVPVWLPSGLYVLRLGMSNPGGPGPRIARTVTACRPEEAGFQAGRCPLEGRCPRCSDVARLTCLVNSVHALGLTSITGPSGSWESRTATSAWPVPTSTQFPRARL
jgi:hypothetical protein